MRNAIRTVLGEPRGAAAFSLLSILIFALLLLVPVWTTPGNDVLFQLSLLEPFVLALMVFLSLANGLLITMQLHIRRVVRERQSLAHHATKTATAMGVAVSAILSTLACAACYSSILSLLGLGTTVFIVAHRGWFAAIAIGISMIALAYSARRINHHCAVCEVPLPGSAKR